MVLGAQRSDVTGEDAIAFARAMGNQMVQSLELADVFARLAASELRYRTLLESASDAIAVLDLDGGVREVNRRWVEVLGRPREEIVGSNIRSFAPRGNAPTAVKRPDGSQVLMEFAETPMDLGGERQVFSVGRDVTERVRAQEQLMVSDRMASVGTAGGGGGPRD